MIMHKDMLTGDELDGKWVVQGAIDVDIGANPSAEGGEDEGVDEQAVKKFDIVGTFRLQCVVQGAIDVDIGANPSARWWLSKGTPLNSSGYGENWHESKVFALVAPQSLSAGDGSSSSIGAPVPFLWLDSGAAIHVVGDAKILTNLCDPPTNAKLMLPVMAVAHEFFRLPPEEKAKLYSDEPAKKMRLSTSFIVPLETVHNWRDHLHLHHHPLEQFVPDWPAKLPPFRCHLPLRKDCKLSEGTPLKSSGYGENKHESKMFALVAPPSLPPGDVSSSSTGMKLWLDSGAAIHVVGDAKILTNLRDPPTEMVVTVADGFQLPITKVGVIQAPDINISDVYLAPGLKMNLISVRQLAKSGIVTTFYENSAELCIKGERIGRAIVDNHVPLYILCFFKPNEGEGCYETELPLMGLL